MARIAKLKEKSEALDVTNKSSKDGGSISNSCSSNSILDRLEVFESLKTNLGLYVGIIDLICKMGHQSLRPRHWKVGRIDLREALKFQFNLW